MCTGRERGGKKEGARSATEGPMKKKKREKINHEAAPPIGPFYASAVDLMSAI